eukprot:gene27225-2479_t
MVHPPAPYWRFKGVSTGPNLYVSTFAKCCSKQLPAVDSDRRLPNPGTGHGHGIGTNWTRRQLQGVSPGWSSGTTAAADPDFDLSRLSLCPPWTN